MPRSASDAVEAFAEHLEPIRIGTYEMPPPLRRLAVRLSFQIGLGKTGYLFGVHPGTVSDWRGRERL